MAAPLVREEREEICKRLGALPLVVKLLRDLGMREVVDRYCPIRQDLADYTHGQMFEVLVANRLTAPHPLYRFDDWAEEFAVGELLGIEPGKLNDDRMARTLDAIAPVIDEIQMEAAKRAVQRFGVRFEQVHLDITSFMFEGAYEKPDPDFPCPKRGYNAEGDFSRKQVRTGQVVTEDGNIPVFHKTFDGNRPDTETLKRIFEGLEFMRAAAKPKSTVYVGDSKLLSCGTLLFLLQKDVLFVAPGERGKALTEELLKLDPNAWVELPYASQSELARRKNTPEEEHNKFWSQESTMTVKDPKSDRIFVVRRIMIRSSDEVRASRKNRERRLQKAEEELQKVANGIPRYYKTLEKVNKKVDLILEGSGVRGLLDVTVGTREGRPCVEWSRNDEAIEKADSTSGCYPILTSLPLEYTANDVLKIQKDEYRVEHRFKDWKGPLGVSPIFLHKNSRIAAMLLVTAHALTIFSLIERQVRKEMCDAQGYAVGFAPERRKSRPTGASIFYALRVIAAIITRGEPNISRVANLNPLVGRIHAVFGLSAEALLKFN